MAWPTLASLFNFSGTAPEGIGVQNYGKYEGLAVCPSTPNCLSSSEDETDTDHYSRPLTFDPSGDRKVSPEEAIQEVADVITTTKPNGFEPECALRPLSTLSHELPLPILSHHPLLFRIVKRDGGYLYATCAR